MRLSDEYLMEFFGKDSPSFSYAIIPYSCIEEYNKDKELLSQYNSAGKSQDNFLLIHAAKVERTDDEILGLG